MFIYSSNFPGCRPTVLDLLLRCLEKYENIFSQFTWIYHNMLQSVKHHQQNPSILRGVRLGLPWPLTIDHAILLFEELELGSAISGYREVRRPLSPKTAWWVLTEGNKKHNNGDVFDRGVSKNRGIPKWMVYNGKPYDLGVPLFFGNTHSRNHLEPLVIINSNIW